MNDKEFHDLVDRLVLENKILGNNTTVLSHHLMILEHSAEYHNTRIHDRYIVMLVKDVDTFIFPSTLYNLEFMSSDFEYYVMMVLYFHL